MGLGRGGKGRGGAGRAYYCALLEAARRKRREGRVGCIVDCWSGVGWEWLLVASGSGMWYLLVCGIWEWLMSELYTPRLRDRSTTLYTLPKMPCMRSSQARHHPSKLDQVTHAALPPCSLPARASNRTCSSQRSHATCVCQAHAPLRHCRIMSYSGVAGSQCRRWMAGMRDVRCCRSRSRRRCWGKDTGTPRMHGAKDRKGGG